MVSKAERIVAESLRAVLARCSVGQDVGPSSDRSRMESALCWFVPEVLGQLYPHWRGEDLDGIDACVARKVGDRAIEIIGTCVLLDDQTETPIHVRMSCAAAEDAVDWMECRVGIPGPGRGGLLRLADSATKTSLVAARVAEDPDAVDWVFSATYGERPGA